MLLLLITERQCLFFCDRGIDNLIPDKYKYRISKCNVEGQSEKNIVFNIKMGVNVNTERDTKFSSQIKTQVLAAHTTHKVVGKTCTKMETIQGQSTVCCN